MNRLTIAYIQEQFRKENYQLLTKRYINSRQKLYYICPKGHEHSIRLDHFRNGHRCPYCIGNSKPSMGFIRSEFEKNGYVLLAKKYINCEWKLNYVCPNGHKHSISWSNWRRGNRCPYCANQPPITIEFIKAEFIKKGYELLTTEYKDNAQKLKYRCPEGHEHEISWANWRKGQRCSYCVGNVKLTIEFIRSEFAKEGYKLLTETYRNAKQKLKYICPNGHKHSISWSNWKTGKRCPYCVIIVSKGEVQVRNFVESLGIKVSANDRNQIFNPETGNGLELDIFMPIFNRAIEYNGEYWHRDENRDLLKHQLCKSKGIDLLTIWDKEWKANNKECKEKIMGFMFNDGERRRNYEAFIGR